MNKRITLALTVGTLALTLSSLMADNSKTSSDLQGADPKALVDVIVQYRQPPTDGDHQRVQDKGGSKKADLPLVNGALYSMPGGALNDVAAGSNVVYVSPDRKVKSTRDTAEPAVNANIALQYGWDGSGIGVAIIDSGITLEDDLKNPKDSRIVYNEDFAGGGPADTYGHGTHVAGIVGGNGKKSFGAGFTRTFQ